MRTLFVIKLVSALFLLSNSASGQGVGINTTGVNPDASSMLDVSSSDKGVLLPRVALTATNVAGPIVSPATSLVIYNTATAGTVPNNVSPGFYYWDGTQWQRFINGDTWREWNNDIPSYSVDDRIYHNGQVVIGYNKTDGFNGVNETDFDASADAKLIVKGNIVLGDEPRYDPTGGSGFGNFGLKFNSWRQVWNGDKIGAKLMTDFQISPGCGDTRVPDIVLSIDPGTRACTQETDDPTEEVIRFEYDGDVTIAGLAGTGTETVTVDANGTLQRGGGAASSVTHTPFHDDNHTGVIWTHPTVNISVSFDPATEIVTVTNNTGAGSYWDVAIIGSTSSNVIRNANVMTNDVANGASLALDLGLDDDGTFTVIAGDETVSTRGFVMEVVYWDNNISGLITHW